MLRVLREPSYAKLFCAQVVALLGTGLLTVALGLLAFEIAGGDAGIVLGTALTIKMLAYVLVSPVMAAIAARLPRKALLVTADLVRAGVALTLPIVTEAWQIYLLIFLLQTASATFTPAFQAVIPELLVDERDYTRALSLSRLAYDLESLLSPVIAAVLLSVIRFNELFLGTFLGFACSAILVLATRFPQLPAAASSGFLERLTRGIRVFARTPELRGLLSMNLVVAAGTAMVIVNSVVLVQGVLGRPDSDVAILLAAYGAGSMIVALGLPPVLDRLTDRPVMLVGTLLVPVGLLAAGGLIALPPSPGSWAALLVLWAVLGAATSLILTPSARLLRRASDDSTRSAVFAAQFSLSHACFLLTYPIAGVVGASLGLTAAALIIAAIAAPFALLAPRLWPRAAVPVLPSRLRR